MDSRRRIPKPLRVVREPRGKILLIHGHDELNVLRLDKALLRKGYDVVILNEQPAQGRTIIEKFEHEASDIDYAIALVTPDDFVHKDGDQYPQARQNVIFEIGWTYAKLGRSRVIILHKQGTALPSDLDGINRIEFSDNVREVLQNIQDELEASLD